MKPLWVVALLLCVALAGCAGSKEADPGAADTDSTTTTTSTGIQTDDPELAATLGDLQGIVANEAGLVIADARVSIIGEEFFTRTDEDGEFFFDNIPEGPYTVSAQKQGFLTAKQQVTVIAQETVNITIQLPLDGSLPENPHIHDRWGGKTSHVMLDAEVDITDFSEGTYPELEQTLFGPLVPNGYSEGDFRIPIIGEPEELPYVLPGTAEMTFTLSWDDEAMPIDNFAVIYNSPCSSETYEDADGQTDWIENGGSFSMTIHRCQWDNGHRQFSRWILWGIHDNRYDQPTGWEPAQASPLQVKIELTKGGLGLEDAHRDFWAGATQLVLNDGSEPVSNPGINVAYSGRKFNLAKEGIIPPGTGKLTIEFSWEQQQGAPQPWDWSLYWVTANNNPQTRSLDDYVTQDPVAGGHLEGFKTYEVSLEDGDQDGYYDTRSNWHFIAWNEPAPDPGNSWWPNVAITMKVTAHLDEKYLA